MYKLFIEGSDGQRIELGRFNTAKYVTQAVQFAINLFEYCENPITDTPFIIVIFPDGREEYLT